MQSKTLSLTTWPVCLLSSLCHSLSHSERWYTMTLCRSTLWRRKLGRAICADYQFWEKTYSYTNSEFSWNIFFCPKTRQSPAITCHFSLLYLSLKDRNLINSLMPGNSEGKRKAKVVYLENISSSGRKSEESLTIEISHFWKGLKSEQRQPYLSKSTALERHSTWEVPVFHFPKVYN